MTSAMATTAEASTARLAKAPPWFWVTGALALAWNLFGVVQFAATSFSSEQELVAGGMTTEQAALYAGLPVWMTAAFATGVFGGVTGSVLLLMRHRLALPVCLAALVGYLVLYAGDITQGVFAAFGTGQVVVLTLVVAVAAFMVVLASALRPTPHGLTDKKKAEPEGSA